MDRLINEKVIQQTVDYLNLMEKETSVLVTKNCKFTEVYDVGTFSIAPTNDKNIYWVLLTHIDDLGNLQIKHLGSKYFLIEYWADNDDSVELDSYPFTYKSVKRAIEKWPTLPYLVIRLLDILKDVKRN